MPQLFYILFGALFTVAVCASLGILLLNRLKLSFHQGEHLLFAFVTGSSGLSLIVFLLAAAGLAIKAVFLVVGAIVIAFAVRKRSITTLGPLPALPALWRVLFVCVFSIYTVLFLFNAMAPEISPDGSGYHLGLVSRYLREHGFHRIDTNMYANLSQGVEMLFMFGFAFGRHSSASLVHLAFLLALPLLMISYARRSGFGSAGALAAIFTFASPVVGIDGTSAYIDVAVACILFALFYLLQIWSEEKKPALLVPVGLLAGFAFAAKYTAFLAIPYAFVFVGWKLFRAKQPVIRPLLTVALFCFALTAPWLLKNWILVQNPLSPFFNSVFPNRYVTTAFEQDYAGHMRNYGGLESYRQIPLEVTVRGIALQGFLGPLFLLAPLGLLALSRVAGRQLVLAGVLFALPYAANLGTRFLIPAIPFLALAMGMVIIRAAFTSAALAVAHAVLSWPAMTTMYTKPWAWHLREIPVRAALRITPEEHYLIQKRPGYVEARMVEAEVPKGERVFAHGQLPDAYVTREVVVAYQSAFGLNIQDLLWTPLIPEFQPTRRFVFPLQRGAFRNIRIVQTAGGKPDRWSISELQFHRGGRPLPIQASWKATASSSPWDARLAMDGNPITRWRTGEPIHPGMYFEIDFDKPVEIDSVSVDATRDQYAADIELEALTANSGWRRIGKPAQDIEIPVPDNLRRRVAGELKALGIRYVLINDQDFEAADVQSRSSEWSFTFIAQRGAARLYRID